MQSKKESTIGILKLKDCYRKRVFPYLGGFPRDRVISKLNLLVKEIM